VSAVLLCQLEVVRKLAARVGAATELRAAIDGAADLAKQGLIEARDAVGAMKAAPRRCATRSATASSRARYAYTWL
jgi:hypothetical protein